MGIHQCLVDVPGITIVLFTTLQDGQKCDAARMILFSKLLLTPSLRFFTEIILVDGLNRECLDKVNVIKTFLIFTS